jgi:hypothetical protein
MLKSFSKLTIEILIAGDSFREEILKQAHEKEKNQNKKGWQNPRSFLADLAARNFSFSFDFKTKVIWGGVDSNKRFTLNCFKEEEGL